MMRQMELDRDFESVCSLVNCAYEVETGNQGIGFKKEKRFHNPTRDNENLINSMKDIWVLEENGVIGGCIRVYVNDEVAFIGPIAVDPNLQGCGIGKKMLNFAESFASTCQIEVVSCRTDIIPMYERRGYKIVDKTPITNVLSESQLTRFNLDFLSMQKSHTL